MGSRGLSNCLTTIRTSPVGQLNETTFQNRGSGEVSFTDLVRFLSVAQMTTRAVRAEMADYPNWLIETVRNEI